MRLMKCKQMRTKLRRYKLKLGKRRMMAKLDKKIHLELKLIQHHRRRRDGL
jgi:hypothetical protein